MIKTIVELHLIQELGLYLSGRFYWLCIYPEGLSCVVPETCKSHLPQTGVLFQRHLALISFHLLPGFLLCRAGVGKLKSSGFFFPSFPPLFEWPYASIDDEGSAAPLHVDHF